MICAVVGTERRLRYATDLFDVLWEFCKIKIFIRVI